MTGREETLKEDINQRRNPPFYIPKYPKTP